MTMCTVEGASCQLLHEGNHDSQHGTVVEVEADDLDHISIALLCLTYACVEMLNAFEEV